PHVEAEPTESQPPAEPELDSFPLVARHAATHGEQSNALFPTDVHHAAAPGVQHVRPEGRVADRVRDIRNVRHGKLGLGLYMVPDESRVARVTIERAVLAR